MMPIGSEVSNIGDQSVVRNGRAMALAMALGSVAVALSPSASFAQAGVAPPSRDELQPPVPRPDVRSGVTLTIDGEMERPPCALDNPQYADIRVSLSNVRFVGAESAPDVDLADTYSPYVGQSLPLSVLCDIRAQATAKLRRAGYLVTVQIPEQRLSEGVAEFQVIFGKLTALRIRGDAGPSETLVASYLEPLVGGGVFNTQEAERRLLLAEDLPGVDVRLSLRPAGTGVPGELVGEVAAIRRRGALDLNIQNYGSKALGRFGGLLRGELYDLTGMGDRTSLSVFSSADFDEQLTLQAGHDFKIGSDGFGIGAQVTHSWTDPTLSIPGFDVESKTLFASIEASYPLKRTRKASIFGNIGVDLVDQDVEVNNIALTQDRVRMAYLRIDGDFRDSDSIARIGGYTVYEPKYRVSGSVEARRGFDVLGASPDCRTALAACLLGATPPSRLEADPTPTVFRFEGTAEYRPVPKFTMAFGFDMQYSNDPLPAFEEFTAGTYSIGRGYDPGAVIGDRGIGLSAEARVGSLAPSSPDGVAFQPYIFTDMAWVENVDPSRRLSNPDRLWSAGGGVRAIWGSRMQADVAVAVPLERPDFQQTRGDVRVLFSLTTRLFPWSF